ncbi:MAG TPA: glycogen-binding domain-containing protein [Pseudomonadales bacterium]|nr:glycogen-binding domain-containing protein [Pseudomonadales bacterium]
MAKKTSSSSKEVKEASSPKAASNGGRAQGFSFRAPEAISVQLVGDFTHWQDQPISLRKDATGVWHTSVELKPGEHHYRFLVDGEWRDDPDCSMRVPNPFGSQNMARRVN